MQKFISFWTLALLQLVIVGNLQILPTNAIYGFSLPFLYLLAVVFFFIPCIYMTAKLASTYPQTGGAYIWCEKAFGKKVGFFTVTILWVSNLLWYPSIFVLIAANLAYLFDPAFAQNKYFIVGFGLILFWGITALNCIGVKISTRMSVVCSVLGIIIPIILMIFCGLSWWLSGKPLAISLAETPLIPDLSHFQHVGYLIAIVISLFGIEVTAVHAGDVKHPKKNYPISLFISSILLLILLIGAEMSIAVIVPPQELSVVTGLLDALILFFQETPFHHLYLVILLLVFLGNVGSVTAWMLGSTRGMYVACLENRIAPFLQKVNRHEAPVGVLLFEAIIFTGASSVFLLFPHVTDSFWILLCLASQITLIYYSILFISAMRLACFWPLMLLGMLTSLVALFIGFIAPPDLDTKQIVLFYMVITLGLLFAFLLPLLFLRRAKE